MVPPPLRPSPRLHPSPVIETPVLLVTFFRQIEKRLAVVSRGVRWTRTAASHGRGDLSDAVTAGLDSAEEVVERRTEAVQHQSRHHENQPKDVRSVKGLVPGHEREREDYVSL